jgi:hypothetical protein
MPKQIDYQALSQEAGMVFKGTVKQQGAATMPQVPINNKTLVVTVDEILKAPDTLQPFVSKDITVQLGEGQQATAGQQYVFFCQGWMFGESIALVAIGVAQATDLATKHATAAVSLAPDRAMTERIANAEMVISGRVVDVRDVPHNEPITEHDPKWREAIVHVDTVAKGQQPDTGQDTVVVRFAASKDIKWHRAPKFHVDQQGVWILGNAKAPLGLAAVGGEPNTYTVVDPRDFHPAKELPRVQSLVAESGGGS